MRLLSYAFLIVCYTVLQCSPQHNHKKEIKKVQVGASILIKEHLHQLQSKNIALLANQSSKVDNQHILDILIENEIVPVTIFSPEHGFWGKAEAGEKVNSITYKDIRIYSLYGKQRKPTPKMLENIDIILIDLQDVGARFYTYYVTMGKVLESVAGSHIEVWVLDRPNPAGGDYVDGWILENDKRSFVGAYPIPVAHGMTMGELARMIIGENWLDVSASINLRVIGMSNWQRNMKWLDTGLPWVAPSPNLPSPYHAFIYLGTCFIEGSTLSEGRGTDDPFLLIGDPNTTHNLDELKRIQNHHNVELIPTTFTPISIPNKASKPKHENQLCQGIRIGDAKNIHTLKPVQFGLDILNYFLKNTAQSKTKPFLSNLAGTDKVYSDNRQWDAELDTFKQLRKKYLLYK